jgi:hypothetical protein
VAPRAVEIAELQAALQRQGVYLRPTSVAAAAAKAEQ